MEAYKEVYSLRKSVYGLYNPSTVSALTELAYANYVQEYSSGAFNKAR